jgi:VWFA-related protein
MPDGQVMTGRNAMGALSMQLLGDGDDDLVQRALRTILTRAPAWEGEPYGEYPFYYWYYGTRAAYLAGGRIWDVWKQATCGMLVRHQNSDGSWALTGKEAHKLDPVYGASLGALILEICCGSPPIYLRTNKAPPRKAPPRNQISVSIENPVDGAQVQGQVEIWAVPEVPRGTTVARMAFSLDGRELGELTGKPWVWEVDLGPGVRPHTFTVTAENDLGTQASHTVTTRAGQDRIGVRIVSPRAGVVLGVRELFVRASDHADSPLDSLVVMVDSVVVYHGAEPEVRIQHDFGTIGGQRIEARAVNALGTAAEDVVILPEERPLEVDLAATVTDAGNNYILDLEQERFQVLEDGVPQTIVRFSRELTPVSMAVVMDVSGSIRRHLSGVQQAAGQFVSQIRPEDWVMIIEFSDQARMVQNFTSDVGRLKSVINKSKARGGTALYDAVVMACDHLKRQQGRTAVILLTDGKDEDAKGTKPGSRHTFEETIEAARESGVTIYALGLGQGVATEVLEELSQKSGGRAYFPPTVEDLREVYGLVAEELRSQYTIGYSSTNRLRDGAWRELEVTVPGTDYVVRAKKGYFAR